MGEPSAEIIKGSISMPAILFHGLMMIQQYILQVVPVEMYHQ